MGQHPAGCCGSKCGQPAIVTIGDDVCPPEPATGPDGDPGLSGSAQLPMWLSELAPSLIGKEAERAADAWVRCGEELRRRTRQFVRRAMCGVPCWCIDEKSRNTVPASYIIDETLETFLIETPGPPEATTRHATRECKVAEMRNIWVCADSELARRVHSSLKNGCDADIACVLLIDAPSGPLGLVERSSEAREEFLDCMAVLIAAQRLRCEPEVARCRRVGGLPPPEARLRPFGKSLQSAHVSGPICSWLAQAATDLIHLMPNDGYNETICYNQKISKAAPMQQYSARPNVPDEIDARSYPRGPKDDIQLRRKIRGGPVERESSDEDFSHHSPLPHLSASSTAMPMIGDWVADQPQPMIPIGAYSM